MHNSDEIYAIMITARKISTNLDFTIEEIKNKRVDSFLFFPGYLNHSVSLLRISLKRITGSCL